MNIDTELITVEEMCDLLHIGKNKAYKLLDSGEVPCFRMCRTWKIPRGGIDVYIQRQCEEFQRKAMTTNRVRTGKVGRPRKIDVPYHIN